MARSVSLLPDSGARRKENNMNNNYPEHILRVLRERNDLEEDDTS